MMYEYLKQITLLYVEDDIAIREVLSKGLQRYVKKLYVAEDGKEGLELYGKYTPDLILTDITMPNMNGIDMSKQIREQQPAVPIIIVSAHGETKFLLDSIACGISNYLLKPIDKDTLFTMLEEQARNICLERINQEQHTMLQNILDAEQHISLVTDFNKVMFINKRCKEFFDIADIQSLQEKYSDILDIFEPMEQFINKRMIEGYDDLSIASRAAAFYKKVESIDETKRIVLIIDKKFTPRSFYISISMIEEKGVYLINLMDITEMTIEKVDTQKKAYTDKLTGLNNRNKMVEFYDNEVKRANRYSHPMSIAVLDIDHFKGFNDTYGHLIGDEVLQMMANSLSQNVRTTDMLARWGGEEFVIIFVETALEDAVRRSDMIREKIEQLNHQTAGKITASFGVTQYNHNDTLESLFERCDKALYEAKHSGRNRVCSI